MTTLRACLLLAPLSLFLMHCGDDASDADGTGGGIALRAVANGVFRSAADSPDDTQTSIEPYFVYDGPVLVRAGFMFAIDEPLGFGGDNDFAIVAPHLTIGARLDAIRARSRRDRTAERGPTQR